MFHRNILHASSGGCLKMEVVCLRRTVTITFGVFMVGHIFNVFRIEMMS